MFGRMPGQGPRSCAAASAAVGETILAGEGFIPSPAKWWGPAVLDPAVRRPPECVSLARTKTVSRDEVPSPSLPVPAASAC